MKTLFVRIFILLLFPVAFSNTLTAAKKPLAADLVRDGQEIDLQQEQHTTLFRELEQKHGYTRLELNTIFKGVTIKRKVLILMDTQWETKPYYLYRPRFITRSILRKAWNKLKKHRQVLDHIEQETGVDLEVVIAIWGIESRFGNNRGSFNVFQSLNTLFDAYPRRSDFFRKQLIEFLALYKENNYDPLTIKGSYAGDFGQTQFIPSNFRSYAVSFDGNEQCDVFGSIEDILASIANYLSHFHWSLNAPLYADIASMLKGEAVRKAHSLGRKGLVDYLTVQKEQKVALPIPPQRRPLTIVRLEKDPKNGGGSRYIAGYPNFQAITEWNHSNRYAMAVCELAEAIRYQI